MSNRILIIVFIAVLVFAFLTADSEKSESEPETRVISSMGTTRDKEYQDAWEKADKEVKAIYGGGNIPLGLVLPNGLSLEGHLRLGVAPDK